MMDSVGKDDIPYNMENNPNVPNNQPAINLQDPWTDNPACFSTLEKRHEASMMKISAGFCCRSSG